MRRLIQVYIEMTYYNSIVTVKCIDFVTTVLWQYVPTGDVFGDVLFYSLSFRGLDSRDRFSAILYKGDNIYDFLFAFLHTKSLLLPWEFFPLE